MPIRQKAGKTLINGFDVDFCILNEADHILVSKFHQTTRKDAVSHHLKKLSLKSHISTSKCPDESIKAQI